MNLYCFKNIFNYSKFEKNIEDNFFFKYKHSKVKINSFIKALKTLIIFFSSKYIF